MPLTKAKDSPYQVQVLDRAVTILDTLAAHDDDLSLFELAERLSLHKSTIHRLLMVLERHRLVERRAQSGKYGLGLRLFLWTVAEGVEENVSINECFRVHAFLRAKALRPRQSSWLS